MSKSNITFKGYIPDKEMEDVYAHAKAFIINSVEDFGIAPVEAQAAGIPVIAYAKGGVKETVLEGRTGMFYEEQSATSLNHIIDAFEQETWKEDVIRSHAKTFADSAFKEKFTRFLNEIKQGIL